MKAGGVPPSSIKVGALRYAVKPVRHLAVPAGTVAQSAFRDDLATNDAGDVDTDATINLLGMTSTDSQELFIESCVGPDMGRVVLLHEVTHAIFAQVGMRDTINDPIEESIVKRLAPLLLQTLRDNPKLVSYLVRR